MATNHPFNVGDTVKTKTPGGQSKNLYTVLEIRYDPKNTACPQIRIGKVWYDAEWFEKYKSKNG